MREMSVSVWCGVSRRSKWRSVTTRKREEMSQEALFGDDSVEPAEQRHWPLPLTPVADYKSSFSDQCIADSSLFVSADGVRYITSVDSVFVPVCVSTVSVITLLVSISSLVASDSVSSIANDNILNFTANTIIFTRFIGIFCRHRQCCLPANWRLFFIYWVFYLV